MPGPVPPPPHWGAPPPVPPKKRRTGLVIGLVAGGVLLVLCLCGGLVAVLGGGDQAPSGTETTTSEPDQDAAETPEPTEKTEQTAKIGEPVRDGKFEFVVKKVRCGVSRVGNQYLNEKAQGQFCLVTLTVRNIGDEPQTFNDFDQLAHDSKSREYKPDSEAGIYANQDTEVWLNEINPGNKITGVLVFDIPEKTKLTSLELHDSSFSGGVTVSLTS
jgi:hypothetical protein